MAGRAQQAFEEAVRLVAENPADCAANATLAGLRQERGLSNLARQSVAAAIAAAAADNAGPMTTRCGVLSLAALGDAPGAAAQLRRIAGSERLLRGWALDSIGMSGGSLLRIGLYPLSRVIDHAEVVDARRELDRAYAAVAAQVGAALGNVTPQ